MESPNDPHAASRTARIFALAQELDATIQRVYGDDANVADLAFCGDVITQDDDGNFHNPVVYVSNQPRAWIVVALLSEAVALAESLNDERLASLDRVPEDDDSDDD